jgi:hypothetical protein
MKRKNTEDGRRRLLVLFQRPTLTPEILSSGFLLLSPVFWLLSSGLLIVIADIADAATVAQRVRAADSTSVQNQRIRHSSPGVAREDLAKPGFDVFRIL